MQVVTHKKSSALVTKQTSADHRASAVLRLQADLKEVLKTPLQNVSALPLEADIFTWHVNIRGGDAPLDKGVFHLILSFPPDYPLNPPSADLCTFLPHPFVFEKKNGKQNWICLDMLQDGGFNTDVDKNLAFTGWTSGYSVLSILLQLQSFLLNSEINFAQKTPESIQKAIAAANAYRCSSCPHHGSKAAFPEFPTAAQIKAAAETIIVSKIRWSVRPAHLKPAKPLAFTSAASSPSVAGASSSATPAPASSTAASQPSPVLPAAGSLTSSQPQDYNKPTKKKKAPKADGWNTVVYDRSKLRVRDPATANQLLKEKAQKKKQKQEPPVSIAYSLKGLVSEKQISAAIVTVAASVSQPQADTAASATKKTLRRYAEKARQRARKRAEKLAAASPIPKKNKENVKPEVSSTTPPVSAPTTPSNSVPSTTTALAVVSSKSTPARSVIAANRTGVRMGAFAAQPTETIVQILSYLAPWEIANMSVTCKDMREICEDGYLWRELFALYYPHYASIKAASQFRDWKQMYLREVQNIQNELRCFHTRRSYEDDVLGVPLVYTTNPLTQLIDYIGTSFDLLSATAYYDQHVRRTVWKEEFQLWLPLYINHRHFERARPHIEKTMVKLCPQFRSSKFSPEMVLEVLPRIMNTMIVLIVDKGIHASQKALQAYCAFHRLLAEFVLTTPGLQRRVDTIIASFMKSDSNRHKEVLPSLGNFLPLLSVCSQKYHWRNVAKTVIEETFDRNVIWICKGNERMSITSGEEGVDQKRLDASFKHSETSLRLLMFHVYFLEQIARPLRTAKAHPDDRLSLEEVCHNYDRYFGRPSHEQMAKFQTHVRKILGVSAWPEFFRMCELAAPSPLYLCNWLRQSVKNSLKRGYHRHNTNFAAIQKSGTSKILKRGDQFSVQAGIPQASMSLGWTFPQHTIFLDAHCFVFDFNNQRLFCLDYMNRKWGDSMKHSGDQIDGSMKTGTHTIDIQMPRVPENVKCLMFCISAWAGARLSDVLSPWVYLVDANKQELCRYTLDSKVGKETCVIMCALYRYAPSGAWKVKAIGQVCEGHAANYAPLHQAVDNEMAKLKSA